MENKDVRVGESTGYNTPRPSEEIEQASIYGGAQQEIPHQHDQSIIIPAGSDKAVNSDDAATAAEDMSEVVILSDVIPNSVPEEAKTAVQEAIQEEEEVGEANVEEAKVEEEVEEEVEEIEPEPGIQLAKEDAVPEKENALEPELVSDPVNKEEDNSTPEAEPESAAATPPSAAVLLARKKNRRIKSLSVDSATSSIPRPRSKIPVPSSFSERTSPVVPPPAPPSSTAAGGKKIIPRKSRRSM